MEWEGGGRIIPSHAQAWMLPSCGPRRHHNRHTSSQLSISRVRASRHIKEKYLLTIQSFRTNSIFTYTAIANNHIVLIHSGGTFKTIFRGPESLFKYLQIFQSHLPLWFFRICFQLAWGVKICFWIYAILKRLLSCSLPMYIFFKTTKQKGLLEEAPLNKQIIFNV